MRNLGPPESRTLILIEVPEPLKTGGVDPGSAWKEAPTEGVPGGLVPLRWAFSSSSVLGPCAPLTRDLYLHPPLARTVAVGFVRWLAEDLDRSSGVSFSGVVGVPTVLGVGAEETSPALRLVVSGKNDLRRRRTTLDSLVPSAKLQLLGKRTGPGLRRGRKVSAL